MKARHGLLDDRFTSVLGAKDVTEFRDQVLKFTKWLGFDLMNAFAAVDKAMGGTEFHCIDNTPEGYRPTFENDDYSRRDPVLQHCKRFSTPIIWDQRTYVESDLIEKWEIQAPFGYRVGVGIALHLSHKKHFFIGVDRDQSMPRNPVARQRVAGDLCLFAAFAQETAMRLLLPPVAEAQAVQLTARELEVLKWAAEGKTAWEVGQILGISDQTVTRHMTTAMHRLECVNKAQAVAKALRLGIIC